MTKQDGMRNYIKSYFLIVFFGHTVQFGYGQHINFIQSKTDEIINDKNKIKANRIKSVSETRYSYSNGIPDTTGQKENFYLFDKKGKLIEKRRHTYGGNEGYFYFIWNIRYDKKNKLLKCSQAQSNDTSIGAWEDYKYHKKEKRTDVIIHHFSKTDTSSFRSAELFFDKKGLNIKMVWYESDTIIEFTHINSFNKKGKIVQTKTFWGEWSLEEAEVQQEKNSNENGEGQEYVDELNTKNDTTTIETKPSYVYKKVKRDPSYVEWKYDEHGHLIEFHSPNFTGNVDNGYKVLYKYNHKTELIESDQMEVNGKVYNKQLFRYDDKGNLIERIEYYGENPAALYKYIYKFY